MFDSPELKSLSRYVRTYLGGLKSLCVDVDGQEWKYLEGGKGEAVVFLHGGVGSKTQWRSLMQEYLPDYRVIAIDVPGLYVNQTFRFKKHSFRQYGVWLGKVLEQLRLPKVHLVGSSLGSTIAAYYAAQCPQQVESLTLLAFPNAILSSDSKSNALLKGVFDSKSFRTVEDMQMAYNRAFFKAPSLPRIVLRYNLREFQKYQSTLESVLTEIFESRPVLKANLRQIKAPTLILQGCEDKLGEMLELEYWQRQIPHAQHHLIPECGHMIHIEKPDEVALLHKALLRSVKQGAKSSPFDDDETGRFAIR